jgi:glucose/arabinose dehydrogenase
MRIAEDRAGRRMESFMTSAVTKTRIRQRFCLARAAVRSAISAVLLGVALMNPGCARPPGIIAPELRKNIDRSVVERPAGYEFERFITSLTAPTAMAFDTDKNALLVAESGIDSGEPRILRFSFTDGSTSTVYPKGKVFGPFRSNPFRMFGPIGGMAVRDGVIYVSHRDRDDMGVISAVGYDGKGKTVVGGLPAQGDYGVTDLTFGPDGRLYFGVGSATNSGVVGLDNFKTGWAWKHPKVADRPYESVRTRGPRFFSPNIRSGVFSGSELAITAPLQPFGVFQRSVIDAAKDGKPNAAIYSIQPTGGVSDDELRVEAHGIRMPAGLAFDPTYPNLYSTNQGMELRGTRPVLNDPDSVLRIDRGAKKNYWWPDYSTDLRPVTTEEFQPFPELLRGTGYTELNFLLDHVDSRGQPTAPDASDRERLVRAVFPSQSGAAKMTFVPEQGSPFSEDYARHLIVALSGDRAPFATSGSKRFKGPVGGTVVRVEVERNVEPQDFLRNTAGVPRSQFRGDNSEMLERPIDVKVGPDGYIYVLDFGKLEMRGGKPRVTRRTGQVFRLRPPLEPAATQPAGDAAQPAATQAAQ